MLGLSLFSLLFRRNKIRVACGILFVLLLFSMFSVAFFAPKTIATETYEPSLTVYGFVQKDIIDPSNILLYQSNGKNQTLEYSIDTSKNISFAVTKVQLGKQFENASTDGVVAGSTEVTLEKNLLLDSNNIRYLLLKISNSSAITNTTVFYGKTIEDTLDLTITGSEYIIFIADAEALAGDIAAYEIKVLFGFVDEYANNYLIQLSLLTNGNSRGYNSVSKIAYCYMNLTKTNVMQIQINKLLQDVGLAVHPSKITFVRYGILFRPNTISASYSVAGKIYAAIISPEPWKIGNVIVNNTKIFETKEISSTLGIYKIADAQIPFIYNVPADPDPDADTLKIKYEWSFMLPDDSALSFSNVVANLTLPNYQGFSIDNVTEFYIDLVDKMDTLKNHKAGDVITVMTSPSVGDLHQISITIKYPEDIYDQIITNQVAFVWYDPGTWTVSFWAVIASILSILFGGIGYKYARAKQREAATAAFKKK